MGSGNYAEDVVFANERVFLLVQLHFSTAVFADQHAVADLYFERGDFAVVALLAGAKSDDFRLLRFLFSAVRNDDSTADLLFFFEVLDEDTVPDRLDFNVSHMFLVGMKCGGFCFCGEQSSSATTIAADEQNESRGLLFLFLVDNLEIGVDDISFLFWFLCSAFRLTGSGTPSLF